MTLHMVQFFHAPSSEWTSDFGLRSSALATRQIATITNCTLWTAKIAACSVKLIKSQTFETTLVKTTCEFTNEIFATERDRSCQESAF
ncbi:hypothetical protein AGR6A_pAt60007 [Agrobacterium sp. NCPPB 925]|nr:hypothetical protein AGR6A_pAt60007 [Agrobacterium sp. NCPPB 925]